MDINTPKGQKSLEYEREATELYCYLHPEFGFIETDKNEPAAIDGFLYLHHMRMVKAIVEVKARDMTLDTLQNKFDNTWLITYDKLLKGREIANLCRSSFVGMLYLIPDKTLLTIRISDSFGDWCQDFSVRETETQETINGGKVTRKNAYIPMRNAMMHKRKWKEHEIRPEDA